MAAGSLVQGVWKYGEDDPTSPFSDTLNLLGASVRTELNTEKARRSQHYISDSGYPVATVATAAGETVVHNRITVPAAAWDRTLVITATVHLTISVTGYADVLLFAGVPTADQVRAQLTAAVVTPFKISGQVLLAAGAPLVVEARFARVGGTGTLTPSMSTLTRMRVSAHPTS